MLHWIHFVGASNKDSRLLSTLFVNTSPRMCNNKQKSNTAILKQDTGFNVGSNNVSSDIKVDPDEFSLQI